MDTARDNINVTMLMLHKVQEVQRIHDVCYLCYIWYFFMCLLWHHDVFWTIMNIYWMHPLYIGTWDILWYKISGCRTSPLFIIVLLSKMSYYLVAQTMYKIIQNEHRQSRGCVFFKLYWISSPSCRDPHWVMGLFSFFFFFKLSE